MAKFLIPLIVLLSFTIASAAPFLVCDPQADVDYYKIYSNGQLVADNVAPDQSGTFGFKYDLQGLTPGSYEWTAEACNAWGCSSLSDPYISPTVLSPPESLRLAM